MPQQAVDGKLWALPQSQWVHLHQCSCPCACKVILIRWGCQHTLWAVLALNTRSWVIAVHGALQTTYPKFAGSSCTAMAQDLLIIFASSPLSSAISLMLQGLDPLIHELVPILVWHPCMCMLGGCLSRISIHLYAHVQWTVSTHISDENASHLYPCQRMLMFEDASIHMRKQSATNMVCCRVCLSPLEHWWPCCPSGLSWLPCGFNTCWLSQEVSWWVWHSDCVSQSTVGQLAVWLQATNCSLFHCTAFSSWQHKLHPWVCSCRHQHCMHLWPASFILHAMLLVTPMLFGADGCMRFGTLARSSEVQRRYAIDTRCWLWLGHHVGNPVGRRLTAQGKEGHLQASYDFCAAACSNQRFGNQQCLNQDIDSRQYCLHETS